VNENSHKKHSGFITEKKKGEKGEKRSTLFSNKFNNTFSFSPYYFYPQVSEVLDYFKWNFIDLYII